MSLVCGCQRLQFCFWFSFCWGSRCCLTPLAAQGAWLRVFLALQWLGCAADRVGWQSRCAGSSTSALFSSELHNVITQPAHRALLKSPFCLSAGIADKILQAWGVEGVLPPAFPHSIKLLWQGYLCGINEIKLLRVDVAA